MSRAEGLAGLPGSQELFAFVDGLQKAGYAIGAEHHAAAQKLLLAAVAEGERSLAASRFKTLLAPAIVQSRSQQEDFYHRFDAWAAGLERPFAKGAMPAAPAPAPAPGRHGRYRMLLLAAFAAAAALAGDTDLASRPTPRQAAEKPVPLPAAPAGVPAGKWVDFESATVLPPPPGAALVRAVLPVLPALGFGVAMAWRWWRRAVWLQRRPRPADADPGRFRLPTRLQPLFTNMAGTDLIATAQRLRRPRPAGARELAVARTIERTIEAGDLFTPVWTRRRRTQDYLVLIEQQSAEDHVARLLDLAVDRLEAEGVGVVRFYYRDDPRHLLQRDERGIRPVPFAEVVARYAAHRLVVLGSGDSFFEPATERLRPALEAELGLWEPRAILGARYWEAWPERGDALVDAGFDLATASRRGLAALAERGEVDRGQRGEWLEPPPAQRPRWKRPEPGLPGWPPRAPLEIWRDPVPGLAPAAGTRRW